MSGRIKLAEGGGGEATGKLIRQVFWSRFGHPELLKGNDAAVLDNPGGRLALSTDAFVITPWRFPGGDIGKLAVCGTVNDLTMMGAVAFGLTASFIVEEGFEIDSLERIAGSMAETAAWAGVPVVAGDTKVVNQGAADGIFISTAGIGAVVEGSRLGGELARAGDRVIISGPIGDHGAAVLLARGEMGITSKLESDAAPLNRMLIPLIKRYQERIRVMRDPTRGGLAAVLNEIARQSRVSIRLEETRIPVRPEVRGITGLLGLDPLYLANEGKAVIIADPRIAEELAGWLREDPLGRGATIIGEVSGENPGLVSLENEMGGTRIIPLGNGEQLPRIC
jgi:hydrogenase expression/formation protein HypE